MKLDKNFWLGVPGYMWLPQWPRGLRIYLQCRRCEFSSRSGKILWRRKKANHFSIIARKTPWIEEPSRLLSLGSQKRQAQLSTKHKSPGYIKLQVMIRFSWQWKKTGSKRDWSKVDMWPKIWSCCALGISQEHQLTHYCIISQGMTLVPSSRIMSQVPA